MATLESLPVELKIEILLAVPDFASLLSTITASRGFYDTFERCKTVILHTILSRIMGEALMREAEALLSLRRVPWNNHRDKVEQLYINHRCVRAFSSSFCDYTLRVSPPRNSIRLFCDPDPLHKPASNDETRRIQHAFYRHWILSQVQKLYKQNVVPPDPALKVTENLSVWDLEEVKIVSTYLQRRLYDGCEEFLARETSSRIPPSPIDQWAAYLTTRSLRLLQKLFSAPTPEQRAVVFYKHNLYNHILPDPSLAGNDALLRQLLPDDVRYSPRRICMDDSTSFQRFSHELAPFHFGKYAVQFGAQTSVNPFVAIWDDERLRMWGYWMPLY